MFQPEARVGTGRGLRRCLDAGQRRRKSTVRPEELGGFDEGHIRIGGEGPDARDEAAGFQQVQIAVGGGVGERGVAGDIRLVQQPARAVSGQRHHALEVRQAGDGAQLAQIALQVSLDVGGKPEGAVGVARDGQRGRITASQQPGRPVAAFLGPFPE